ncbi:hypothetical protein BLNAU_20062 [Blattamonas nauphoetae]|uniref:Testis-expressed sequence 9 protein n=1 Tax=Blattamonas nauphoetae TaxID=2049346 RepID=A0ABQ9WZW1_9EUKA|nr:hypothetical protein BLNAU_20062 [Blattamonas nauphoetae]
MEELIRKNEEIERQRRELERITEQISTTPSRTQRKEHQRDSPSKRVDVTRKQTRAEEPPIQDDELSEPDAPGLLSSTTGSRNSMHVPQGKPNQAPKRKTKWLEQLDDELAHQNDENSKKDSEMSGNRAAEIIEEHATKQGGALSDVQSRLNKAKLQTLENQVLQLQAELTLRNEAVSTANEQLKVISEDKARLTRLNKQLEQQLTKTTTQLDQQSKHVTNLEAQVSALRKENDSLAKEHRTSSVSASAKENKMNRAFEEAEGLKQQLKSLENEKRELVSKARTQEEAFRSELRSFQKQKTELILAFRKQQKLIDVLKRQKMHLEASKLFSFTEDEFNKLIEKLDSS